MTTAGQSTKRVLLRLPAGVHAALESAARSAGLSFNEYCARRLAAPSTVHAVSDDGLRAINTAAALFGEALVAVVLYGSWATGRASASSDVDLFVVLERSVPLTRDLYRRWDAAPLTWQGRPVDPHFAHAPRPDDPPSAAWAEAAIGGVVLYERDPRVSRHLVRVRTAVAEGRLVRRVAHGQPYWTEAA